MHVAAAWLKSSGFATSSAVWVTVFSSGLHRHGLSGAFEAVGDGRTMQAKQKTMKDLISFISPLRRFSDVPLTSHRCAPISASYTQVFFLVSLMYCPQESAIFSALQLLLICNAVFAPKAIRKRLLNAGFGVPKACHEVVRTILRQIAWRNCLASAHQRRLTIHSWWRSTPR